MAEEYDVQAIMNALKTKEEMDPDQHDGCYELMRETIEAYGKMDDYSALDYKDLNLVYLTTVGTWKQGIEGKKKTVSESHLPQDDKEYLTMLWDEIWDKAGKGEYTNYEMDAAGNRSIGMFGTGFLSFQNKTTDKHVQDFIKMCVDILPMTDDTQMFDRAGQVLVASFQGMRAASASMVLHCLKPYSFPVLNSNMGNRNIFEVLGVDLIKRDSIETYISNCRKIKAFRDQNFSYKNYRIFDMAAWKVKDYVISHPTGQFDSWEIIDEDNARKTCDKSFFQYKGSGIPQAIRWFFGAESIQAGDRVDIVLEHDGFEYDARIQKTDNGADQTRIFWDAALAEEFDPFANDGKQHVLEFHRVGDKRYKVELSEVKPARKVWLITWNKNNWYWENFESKCESSKTGQTFVESWACANSNPKVGDEVFLIKLGDQPRGIIGHGIVNRPIYEKTHYDATKAAEGKKEKAIDVVFDRLINYEKDKFISQDELNAKCAGQHWSPQSSGIEIKPAVLPTLYALWHAVTEADNTNNKDGYWPSPEEYPVNLSKDDWKRFIQEVEAPGHRGCMRVLACFIDIGGIASPKTLSDKYKGHPTVYTSSVLNTSRRALNYFNMEPCPDGDTQRYFPIAFLGRVGNGVNPGTYEYKMRPELFEALQELDLSGIDLVYEKKEDVEMITTTAFNHNLILYGPPGTGKTYNSVIYAVSICEGKSVDDVGKEPYNEVLARYNELRDAGRIAFTTFHQSYGYEEFIEGIKPKLDVDSDAIGYSIEDGVFKEFCKRAKNIKVQASGVAKMKAQPRIWGMILGGSGMTDLKKQCFDHDEIRLGWSEVDDDDIDGDFIGDSTVSWQGKHMVSDFKNTMEIGDVVVIEKNNTSIDAIGVVTGEYIYDEAHGKYPRSRSVEWLAKDIDQDMLPFLPNGRKQLSRFSLFAFDYIGMDAISQILNEYVSEPVVEVEKETKPYVFIIDEINRGNISKIFGELITLIEDTKRAGASEAMEAILPYSGEAFSVPNNVYILGTMNTADRSIALMDTALRRRFEFAEMMPNSEVLDSLGVGTIAVGDDELNVARMLDVINERIEYLFDREHTIGHAFFTKLADDPSIETLASIFEKNVIPLLQEYFYEDYEKIQLVLGDNSKEDEFKFILDRTVKVKDIFNGNPDIDLPEKGYSVQHEAFLKLQSYKQIGKDL